MEAWAEAWSNQDVAAYVNRYAKDYRGSLPSRDAWLQQREVRLTNKSFIKVDVTWMRVIDLGDTFSVEFNQRYQSDSFDDTIRKKLIFSKNSVTLAASKIISEQRVD